MEILVQNLSAQKGNRLLFYKLNFLVKSGEILHLLGDNGCGKTSLLRLLAGLSPYKTGDISFSYQNHAQPLKPFLHYLSVKSAMRQALTLFENLKFWQNFYHSDQKIKPLEEEIYQLLKDFSLEPFADFTFQTLSTGQKKRASFLRILLAPRPVWLLDEPFANIDEKGAEIILVKMKKHLRQKGLIICTSHQAYDHIAKLPNYKKLSLVEFSPYNKWQNNL